MKSKLEYLVDSIFKKLKNYKGKEIFKPKVKKDKQEEQQQ